MPDPEIMMMPIPPRRLFILRMCSSRRRCTASCTSSIWRSRLTTNPIRAP